MMTNEELIKAIQDSGFQIDTSDPVYLSAKVLPRFRSFADFIVQKHVETNTTIEQKVEKATVLLESVSSLADIQESMNEIRSAVQDLKEVLQELRSQTKLFLNY